MDYIVENRLQTRYRLKIKVQRQVNDPSGDRHKCYLSDIHQKGKEAWSRSVVGGERMRIVVPVSEDKGEESTVAYHFGRAPYFAIYDSEKDSLEIKQTRKEVSGGKSRLAMKILKYNPDVVFAAGMGRRAVDFFRSNNIRIETGDYNTLQEIIENKDKLRELEEACKEARHG